MTHDSLERVLVGPRKRLEQRDIHWFNLPASTATVARNRNYGDKEDIRFSLFVSPSFG